MSKLFGAVIKSSGQVAFSLQPPMTSQEARCRALLAVHRQYFCQQSVCPLDWRGRPNSKQPFLPGTRFRDKAGRAIKSAAVNYVENA